MRSRYRASDWCISLGSAQALGPTQGGRQARDLSKLSGSASSVTRALVRGSKARLLDAQVRSARPIHWRPQIVFLLASVLQDASFVFFALTAGKAFHCAFEAQITRRDSFRTAKHGYEQWRQTAQ